MQTVDMFPETKTRKPRRVIAHVSDAGPSELKGYTTVAEFECKKCGWKSGWMHFRLRSEPARGIPCEQCN